MRRSVLNILWSAWNYEKGFVKFAYQVALSKTEWWRRVGITMSLQAILLIVLATAFTDFTKQNEEVFGVRAAIAALGAAVCIVLRFVTGERAGIARMAELYGGLCALIAGVFWLLDETGGQPGVYLVALVPLGVVMIIYLTIGFVFGSVWKWEGAFLKQRKKTDNDSRE